MRAARIKSFQEFWPFYLRQHRKRLTRRLHFMGTDIAFATVVLALWKADPWFLLVGIAAAYGFAWVVHFLIERNRPATFQYPLWSFAADWKMWGLNWTGGLRRELRRHGVEDPVEDPKER